MIVIWIVFNLAINNTILEKMKISSLFFFVCMHLTVFVDAHLRLSETSAPPPVYNPNNAYINTTAPGLGCLVCDAYAAGDTFSLDNGVTWYTAVDRALLIQMRDAGADLRRCV